MTLHRLKEKQKPAHPKKDVAIFATSLFVVLVILSSTFLWNAWIAEKDYRIRELSNTLKFAADFCEGYFKRIESVHRMLGVELLQADGQIDSSRAITMLNNYKGINHDQRRFMLYSASGELIADTDLTSNPLRPYYLSEIPVKKEMSLKTPEEHLEFEPSQGEDPDRSMVLPFRYAIRDITGELKYLVQSRLRIGLLQTFWKTALVPQESILGFIHHDGHLISSSSANPEGYEKSVFRRADADELSSYLRSKAYPVSGSISLWPGEGSTDQLIVYRRLTYHPVTVFASVPMSSVLSGWWRRIKEPLILLLAFLVMGGLTYSMVLRQRQSEQQLLRKQSQLQDITQGILDAQEQERRRLSHELHDEIGQSLTALKITLNRAQQNLADTGRSASFLNTGQQMLDKMMINVREIAYRLRPSELDQLGLAAALRSHLDKTIRPLLPNTSLFENIGDRRFSPELELCCFRVAQEALTNCLRHAQATQLRVVLDYEPPRFTLRIIDNGAGFDVRDYYSQEQDSSSLGILGMRERVAANGGSFRVQTSLGTGTEVIVTFDIAGEI